MAQNIRQAQPLRASDLGFWFGSDGLIHNIGVGVVGAFAGPDSAQAIGRQVGALEDMGIEAQRGPIEVEPDRGPPIGTPTKRGA